MQQPAVATTQDIALELALYKGMVELREFELKVQELYRDAQAARICTSLRR